MNFKDFKAGQWIQQYQYKSFSPVHINREWTWSDPQINTLLEKAMQAIGELNVNPAHYRYQHRWPPGQ